MYLGGNRRWVPLMFSYKKNVQTNKELKQKGAFIGVAMQVFAAMIRKCISKYKSSAKHE